MSKVLSVVSKALLVIGIFMFSLGAVGPMDSASAKTPSDALKQSIKTDGSGTATMVSNLQNVVYAIAAVGGVIVIGSIVYSGIKLSLASGGNPQARTQAIIGICCAGAGAFVIYKATTIAGWFVNISSGSTATVFFNFF